jgi:two-component system, NtrC family, sensor kinase
MAATLDDELVNLRRINAELEQKLSDRTAERDEALAQKIALAEVLDVINRSPGDLAPVFDALIENAVRLCGATRGVLQTFDGEAFHVAAVHGDPDAADGSRLGPARFSKDWQWDLATRLLAGKRVVHVADARESREYREVPLFRAAIDNDRIRTALWVALRKEETLLGYLNIYRQEVRPFTDKQIALVQNFAAQAVIAMENARLLTETREALEQQTATAEVLQVINSSPGDLAPVFDAMLEKAMRLCEAAFGTFALLEGDRLGLVAHRSVPPELVESLRRIPLSWPPLPGGHLERIAKGETVVPIDDFVDTPAYRSRLLWAAPLVDKGGARTAVWVALRREDQLLGVLVIYRREVRPFTDKQIALLRNFAAQAVIAMENARLIDETREALEQQTATAEVLQVINSSPGDLAPVFETILEKAHNLCGTIEGGLLLYDGEMFRAVATRGYSQPFAELLRQGFRGLDNPITRRLLDGDRIVHVPDVAVLDHQIPRAAAASGSHTGLFVPLRKDDGLLGMIASTRSEIRPFSDKEIALIENFGAQAVIAMENARLLDEIRQRQAELRVTFDNMVDGVAMFDEELHLAAWNRNFQQLLDLSAEFLAERHGFDDYIRHLTLRGEFGETDPETEIRRRRARIGEHYTFERTRPDGTVIEVRHNPMPGGGFILIYSDITERKRSEAEIRAARDAAEAAYRDLKAAQASLVQAEKMASLGQLTAGIAHEIKNPLNFVNNFADLSVGLLDELKKTAAPAIASLGDEQRAEVDEVIEMLTGNLGKIAEHGRRADGIVKSMLEHSRGTTGERRTVDLNHLVDEALNLAYHGARAQDASFKITLERDFADAMPPIELVPQDITRVCLNLIGNGFYAATKREQQGGDAKFEPTLKVTTRDLGGAVEIRIRDNGVGVAPEARGKLFQPFFTTKPPGEGTGLGLSISYDIVTQQHGGTIEVDSRENEFTEFRVQLPCASRATLARAASRA